MSERPRVSRLARRLPLGRGSGILAPAERRASRRPTRAVVRPSGRRPVEVTGPTWLGPGRAGQPLRLEGTGCRRGGRGNAARVAGLRAAGEAEPIPAGLRAHLRAGELAGAPGGLAARASLRRPGRVLARSDAAAARRLCAESPCALETPPLRRER